MSTRNLEVNLDGLVATLNGLAKGVTFERGLKAVAVLLSSAAKECFDRGASPDGQTWAPLKRQRSRKRDKKGGTGQKPLLDTGLLMASMTAQTGRGAIRDIHAASLEHGTNVEYAGYHQDGTRHIPARPFVGISQKTADLIGEIIADDVARQL